MMMFRALLLWQLLASGHAAYCAETYTEVDDPKCGDPDRPVLPPSPSPSPFPTPTPPPIEIIQFTPEPTVLKTPEPTDAPTNRQCVPGGAVVGLRLVTARDASKEVLMDLYDGMVVDMSKLPGDYTIEALPDPTMNVNRVRFYVNGSQKGDNQNHPFVAKGEYEGGSKYHRFVNIERSGTFKLGARAKVGNSWQPSSFDCEITVTFEYGNPYICQNLVTHMSLMDADEQATVPGFERLFDGQTIDLSELPPRLTVEAHTNSRFTKDNKFKTRATRLSDGSKKDRDDTGPMVTFNGKDSNTNSERNWPWINTQGSYKLQVRGKRADDSWETWSDACSITVHVIYGNKGYCKGLVSHLSLLNIDTLEPVPGYEKLQPEMSLNLAELPGGPENLTIQAHTNGREKRVRFATTWKNDFRTIKVQDAPYYMNGRNEGVPRRWNKLHMAGEYEFYAYAQQNDGSTWESRSGDGCKVKLKIDYGNTGVCKGLATGFDVMKASTKEFLFKLTEGTVIDLSDPDIPIGDLTIQIGENGQSTQMRVKRDSQSDQTRKDPPYLFSGVESDGDWKVPSFLSIEGNYKLVAWGKLRDDRTWEDKNQPDERCEVNFSVVYGGDGICDGLVQGFSLIDTSTGKSPMGYGKLQKTNTFVLSELPEDLTIKALTTGGEKEVKFKNPAPNRDYTRSGPDYYLDGLSNGDIKISKFLKIAGTYTLKAVGKQANNQWETWAESCSIEITVQYRPPGTEIENCAGLVSSFSLISAATGEVFPQYSPLVNGMEINMADIEGPFSITATTVGAEQSIKYKLDGSDGKGGTRNNAPYYLKGLDNGAIRGQPWLATRGTHKIKAIAKNARDQWEDWNDPLEVCEIEFTVTYGNDDTPCKGLISGFTLINAFDDVPIEGFNPIPNNAVLDVANLPEALNIRANNVADLMKKVRFWRNGKKRDDKREEGSPFSIGGDVLGNYQATPWLIENGVYTIKAKAEYRGLSSQWEPDGDSCSITLSVINGRNNGEPIPSPPPPPRKTIMKVIDLDDGPCAPELVASETEGQVMPLSTPVQVVEVITNETVKFKTVNFIDGTDAEWITTNFVSPSGHEVCDKANDVAFEEDTGHVYEAKCFGGFAYADVFVHSPDFDPVIANARTNYLPSFCRNPTEGKVLKFTMVFSCDCENIPDIPDEVVGEIQVKPPKCTGHKGNSWGDPHIITYDKKKWHCQGHGEFILSKATLEGYGYDFAAHARFRKVEGLRKTVSWNDAIALDHGVRVQFSRADAPNSQTTYFGKCPFNFYVDGVQKNVFSGSDTPEVLVYAKTNKVDFVFPASGITAHIQVRPNNPCQLTIDVCLPFDNPSVKDVTGMFGSPDGNSGNDYMDRNGVPMANQNMNQFDYCTNTWCLMDEAESIFVHPDPGFGFDYYQRCQLYTQKGDPDLTGLSQEIKDACALVDNDESCLMDGWATGLAGAEAAVASILEIQQARHDALFAPLPDSSACCSKDFKTCLPESESCGNSVHNCGMCNPSVEYIWLHSGEYDEAPLDACMAKTKTCDHDHDCCPGLDCEDRKCTVNGLHHQGVLPPARRLKQKLLRPDIPFERNIIQYTP